MPGYPVPLVGEQHYAEHVAACSAGDEVQIWHEPDNAYDPLALAVTAHGRTIGYLPQDCWLREAIHGEKKGFSGSVLRLHQGHRGHTQVTIEAVLHPRRERAIGQRRFDARA